MLAINTLCLPVYLPSRDLGLGPVATVTCKFYIVMLVLFSIPIICDRYLFPISPSGLLLLYYCLIIRNSRYEYFMPNVNLCACLPWTSDRAYSHYPIWVLAHILVHFLHPLS